MVDGNFTPFCIPKTYGHLTGAEAERNQKQNHVRETGIVFSTSVLRMRIVIFLSRLYTLRSNRGLSVVVLVDTSSPFMLGTEVVR